MHRMMIVVLGLIGSLSNISWAQTEYTQGATIARNTRAKRSKEFSTATKEGSQENLAPYWNFLPFGGGQFARGKNYMGTALAATQAGSLLLYFDRTQQVRTANSDASLVMKNSKVANDPGTLPFLEQNEKYVLQSQKEAKLFMFSFLGLYTFGVVDAVFDPLAAYGFGSNKKSKKKESGRSKRRSIDTDFDDEPGFTQRYEESDGRLSFLIWQNESQAVYGVNFKAEF